MSALKRHGTRVRSPPPPSKRPATTVAGRFRIHTEHGAPRPMPDSPLTDLQAQLDALGRGGPERVVPAVDLVLAEAVRRLASDVHFEPTPAALEIRLRIDGVLRPVATI